ncbi:DNA gyrase subunit A [Ammoniphilus oxalaticus]|uniref:DNA gyrase subunit A n=1 Tax=Ammoniphilus oxalaticus TaxID=66863 RepID=A0A419SGF5_9BACL|nr:DNA gyrase subunit A [Ammoniphilus oxalaticus]RKD22866.1 DNA gyrase subunit A [Ammoniphilus oxalaticus]
MAEEQRSNIIDRSIAQEMRESFLGYAMSVIVSRALPDVRDGLKPVHRRILFSMNEMGMTPDKPYKKSARIVGDVIGKYHPHGDSAVYETMVRMSQDFSYRYPLIDGHGNFGSIDGDSAAAMRYTEARLSKIATELLRDINKDTIDFAPNYDENEKEPTVLPARFPNLLVNGAAGIAVGMATNIPPHNLGEVIDGILMLIENEQVTIPDLMQVVKGPDFPTAGQIMGRGGIYRAFETGRGSITLRANAEIVEEENGRHRIIVDEIPYQVNKSRLIERIAELVRDKRIDGITDLRDESDRNGMRIVIEMRRDVNPQVLLNNLYKQTALQTTFGINMLALVNGQPQVLNLKEMLTHYLDHQRVVIRRRTEFDLRRAEARAHILEGLRIALDHIDEIISLIRRSQTTEQARNGLMETFSLSYEQSQAILDMRLQRLTGLERDRIEAEYQELVKLIAELRAILADENKVLAIIKDELIEVRDKYDNPRRTEIMDSEDLLDIEDLIPEQEVCITLTHDGYIKRLPVSTYKSQRRGGRGILGAETKDDDYVQTLFVTNSHNYLLIFTNRGKVYRIKAFEVPEFSRTARGIPIINLIQIEQGESVKAVIPVREFKDDRFLFFATKQGIVKRTDLTAYENIRRGGLFAINIRQDDELIGVGLTDGTKDIILGTKFGMSIRFNEEDVRPMGRTATGVKGITLVENDQVIDMDLIDDGSHVLIVTSEGYGKRTPVDEYRPQTRGGKGLITLNVTDRNGHIVALKVVNEEHDLMIVTVSGVIIRLNVNGISTMSRNTQGVKLIRVENDEAVATVAKVDMEEPDDETEEDHEDLDLEVEETEVSEKPQSESDIESDLVDGDPEED